MAQLCAQTFADCRRSSRSCRSGKDLCGPGPERLGQREPFQPFQWSGWTKHPGSELAPLSQPI